MGLISWAIWVVMDTTLLAFCYFWAHRKGYRKGFTKGVYETLEEWKKYNNDDSNWE